MGLGNWPVVRIENLIRAGVSSGFGYSLLGALEPATQPLTVRSPAPVQFMIVLIDAPAPQLLGQRFGDRESISAGELLPLRVQGQLFALFKQSIALRRHRYRNPSRCSVRGIQGASVNGVASRPGAGGHRPPTALPSVAPGGVASAEGRHRAKQAAPGERPLGRAAQDTTVALGQGTRAGGRHYANHA